MAGLRLLSWAGVAATASLLGGCVPSLGPFILDSARGRVIDQDTGEPIRGAEVIEWYRGAGSAGGPQPHYYARWTRSDREGRFAFGRAFAPSLRLWVLKTYGPTYSFYHPSYGLEHGGGRPERNVEPEVILRGSLRHSAQRLADLVPFCRGERSDRGARHLQQVACPPEAHTTYANGTPRATGDTDERGRRTGVWTFYYEEGKVAARGEYQAGAPRGTWEFRDRDGRVVPASN